MCLRECACNKFAEKTCNFLKMTQSLLKIQLLSNTVQLLISFIGKTIDFLLRNKFNIASVYKNCVFKGGMHSHRKKSHRNRRCFHIDMNHIDSQLNPIKCNDVYQTDLHRITIT